MAKRRGITVQLPPALTRFVEERIASGRYGSASDVVNDGLRLLEIEEQQRRHVAQVRTMIEEGAADADAGRLVDGESAMRRWRAEDARLATGRRRRAS